MASLPESFKQYAKVIEAARELEQAESMVEELLPHIDAVCKAVRGMK